MLGPEAWDFHTGGWFRSAVVCASRGHLSGSVSRGITATADESQWREVWQGYLQIIWNCT
jgi:hypothetical protein